ncbi:3-oxoacyl-[acyl-carrier-protein] reductase [Clostridium gasigenes]|uniref:3-oxoacyl-[acyl-carrier-protein] reductase n=1 Tax=Clostridium gasigenes TaxID=94869 RepID=UPI001C0D410A|nr:3-oxoacyl-[acyl-carrier-protein] reductase [Clostridium gasigenes]MBU3103143.1 3-oxoacyl-[acyl-carrier-protein] reductase [Clostridium gasigenes]
MQKRVVVITGSIRGIGREIALEFLEQGDFVIINGRREYEDVIAELEMFSRYINMYEYVKFDISKKEEVQEGIKSIISKHKNIDVLINNAGITRDKSLVKLEHSMWDEVINVNLTGAFNVCKEVVPNMIKNNSGRIINIASVIALSGNFGQTNYAASKSGLIGLAKSLAQEVAKYGITVNAIAPGFIKTDMTKNLPEKAVENLMAKIPMKCFGEASDVANVALFLSSDRSKYITGETISVNGGLYSG